MTDAARTLQLRKFVAPEIVYGQGAAALAGRYMSGLGAQRVLVVSDPGVVAAGWTDLVASTLADQGIHIAVFSNTSPNPRSEQVMQGAAVYDEHGCDGIVAVGGGSPTDCAKGIGVVASNGGHVLDYAGVDRVAVPMPPLVCVPTTSGASADVSQFAIITDESRGVKAAVISKAMVPDVALIDPETLMTLSRSLTACTVLDALTHAIEAFVSNGSSQMTDLHALCAAETISKHLVASLDRLDDIELRSEMMLASLHAGLAFSNASLGAIHAMAHSLGGLLDLPHGHCNALLLPHVVEANYDSAPEKYAHLASAMGVSEKDGASRKAGLVSLLRDLVAAAEVEHCLASVGVDGDSIASLARAAAQDPCMLTNPKYLTEAEIEQIYARAL